MAEHGKSCEQRIIPMSTHHHFLEKMHYIFVLSSASSKVRDQCNKKKAESERRAMGSEAEANRIYYMIPPMLRMGGWVWSTKKSLFQMATDEKNDCLDTHMFTNTLPNWQALVRGPKQGSLAGAATERSANLVRPWEARRQASKKHVCMYVRLFYTPQILIHIRQCNVAPTCEEMQLMLLHP